MMRSAGSIWFFTVALCALSPACSGTGSGNPIGPRQCSTDTDCELLATGYDEMAAAAALSPYQFESTRCGRLGRGSAEPVPSCFCELADGGAILLYAGPASECLYFSRDRTCLIGADEVTTCDLEDSASCEAPCADLQARLDADAQRALDVEVRHATCETSSGWCQMVVRVEGACYDDSMGPSREAQDCAQTDEEILAAGH